MAKSESKRTSVQPKVIEALTKHRGTDVTIPQLVEETGLSAQQLQNCLAQLRTRRNLPITVVVRGSIYRYEAANAVPEVPAKPEKRLFEELAVTKAGVIVAQDQDGKLYTVEEM